MHLSKSTLSFSPRVDRFRNVAEALWIDVSSVMQLQLPPKPSPPHQPVLHSRSPMGAVHASLARSCRAAVACRPAQVEYASEFRYRTPILFPEDIVIAISQSGETADTLAALQLARAAGCLCLGVCNTVGSSIARETHAGIYLHAGPEIGVASTKAFSAQVLCRCETALFVVPVPCARVEHTWLGAPERSFSPLRR